MLSSWAIAAGQIGVGWTLLLGLTLFSLMALLLWGVRRRNRHRNRHRDLGATYAMTAARWPDKDSPPVPGRIFIRDGNFIWEIGPYPNAKNARRDPGAKVEIPLRDLRSVVIERYGIGIVTALGVTPMSGPREEFLLGTSKKRAAHLIAAIRAGGGLNPTADRIPPHP